MKHRFWQIDIARGVAIIGMVLYHFLVDLEMIYGIPIGVYKMPVVLLARIVAITFIFLMGMSASIRFEKSGDNRWFVKRAINIGFWAGVISVVTYIIFPENYIYFGILHFTPTYLELLVKEKWGLNSDLSPFRAFLRSPIELKQAYWKSSGGKTKRITSYFLRNCRFSLGKGESS